MLLSVESNEYFYQVGLTDFGNFGTIRFNPPLNLRSLLSIAAEYEKETAAASQGLDDMDTDDDTDFDWNQAIIKVEQQLISRRELLEEYFSLNISAAGDLQGIPLLQKGYTPSLAKLPRFLLRLGPYVNWVEEKACFRTFLTELASYYVPESLPPEPSPSDNSVAEDPAIKLQRAKLARVLEHVMFPAFRARLLATKGLLRGVVEVANLKGLYRVFERC